MRITGKAPVLACVIAAFALLCAPRPAGASFWQGCLITGTITMVGDVMGHPELGLHITKAETMGGSHATCDDKVGADVTLIITDEVPEDVGFETGRSVTLDYSYYNAMGENGVINDETWKFISLN